jgi:hypothetical protein
VDRDDESIEAELEAVRKERDELKSKVEAEGARKRSRARRLIAWLLVVLTILTFAAGVGGTWARRTVMNTDRYVATVGPLASDPAVQEHLARTVTDQVFQALDVEDRLQSVLAQNAEKLAFLAGPITDSVRGFVQEQVDKVFASPAFARLWVEANRYVHEQALAVLNGDSETVKVVGSRVELNLLPMVNEVLKGVTEVASELIGRPVTIPPITAQAVPSEAVAALETALGVDLPDDFGTIVVYDSTELETVQQAVHLFDRGVVLVVILWAAFFAGALWLATRKRRALIQVTTGMAVVLVLERAFAMAAGNGLVDGAKPENQAAARSVVDQILGSLLRYTGWLLAATVIVLLVALVTGPYPWAARIRGWVRDLGRAVAGLAKPGERAPAAGWVAVHRDAVMLGLALLGIVVMLLWDLSIGGFLLLALVIGVLELLVYRVGGPPEAAAG